MGTGPGQAYVLHIIGSEGDHKLIVRPNQGGRLGEPRSGPEAVPLE